MTSRSPAGRGTAGDAARVLAIGAGVLGAVSAVMLAPLLLLREGDPWPAVAGSAPVVAVVAWILAVAASWTAAVALRRDRRDRPARTALRAALPGVVAGTAVMLVALIAIL